eukprot:jgi/Chlat1/2656/Chrsp178S00157
MADIEAAAAAVAASVASASNPAATSERRKAALELCDQFKNGDPRTVATVAVVLAKRGQPPEIQHFAYGVLQHVLRTHGTELTPEEKRGFLVTALQLFKECMDDSVPAGWAIKAKVASLLAEVARAEGPAVWHELLPTLFQAATQGPSQAELVALALRWLPEDVTVHNEDLQGDRRRGLLFALTKALPQILPFLYKLLEQHFAEAMAALQQSSTALARRHAAVIEATLAAMGAYAEWAPVSALTNAGSSCVDACGHFLRYAEFQNHACDFFKNFCARRRGKGEEAEVFDSAMVRAGEALCSSAPAVLGRAPGSNVPGSAEDVYDEDFAQRLSEALVSLGNNHLHALSTRPDIQDVYLKQMLDFARHKNQALSSISLQFWLPLLRESGQPDPAARSKATKVDSETAAALLETASDRLHRAWASISITGQTPKDVVPEDFLSDAEYVKYRLQLVDLVRLVSAQHPALAVQATVGRTGLAIANLDGGIATHDALDSAVMVLENATSAMPTDAFASDPGVVASIEQFLQQVLSIQYSSPIVAEQLCRILDSFGKYYKPGPAILPQVISKLFDVFSTIPTPTAPPASTSKARRRARQQAGASVLKISLAAATVLAPHLVAFADGISTLQQQGILQDGDHIMLQEALLVIASKAGDTAQSQVFNQILEPLRLRWTDPHWQSSLTSAQSFVAFLAPAQLNCEQRAWLFSAMAMLEKLLKRAEPAAAKQSASHPLSQHLQWILPPLLQLIKCLHELWSPPVQQQVLPAGYQEALDIGPFEKSMLAGNTPAQAVASVPGGDREDTDSGAVDGEGPASLRNFLKGIRESAYQVVGLCATKLPAFYEQSNIANLLPTCLFHCFEAVEARHVKSFLRNIVVPFTKHCPPQLRSTWLTPVLHPTLVHMHSRLTAAWQQHTVPDATTKERGTQELTAEVVTDKLLRDMTREHCALLVLLTQPLQASQNGCSSPRDTAPEVSMGGAADQSSLLFYLLQHEAMASAAIHTAISALSWPDSESAHKAVAFCSALTTVAVGDARLHAVVGAEVLHAAISALTFVSNQTNQSDLIALIREIYVKLSPCTSAPSQVLLSLPTVNSASLQKLQQAVSSTGSEKEQRQLLKQLLLAAGGDDLKALSSPVKSSTISNLPGRTMAPKRINAPKDDDTGMSLSSIGL